MKTYRYLFTLMAIMTGLAGQSQLVQVYPEVYAEDGIPGYTTYRIFAELEDPTDALSGVFAYGPHPLIIGSSGNVIYNDSFGSTTGDALSTAFCDFVPSICHDSFVTIGWVGQYNYLGDPIGCGQATTTVSSLPNSQVIQNAFGTEIAENLNMEDGAWFSTNLAGCNTNLLGVGPNNKVLIAQVTIPSDHTLQYLINLQIFNEADGQQSLMYVGTPPEAGEIDGSDMGLVYPNANCPDPAACNYNDQPDLDDDMAVCVYSCYGCTDSSACNFDPSAGIDDGSCTTLCEGCTNSSASNYDPNATVDDGSCIILGCSDTVACNYDSGVTADDGTCDYITCYGCTDSTACNYDSTATMNDGSCLTECSGCTDSTANNYDPQANVDDGSCVFGDYALSFEPYVVHTGPISDGTDLTGFTTYRMYLYVPDPTDEVSSVYGVMGEPMNVMTTTGFYQNEFGSHLGSEIQPAFFNFFPSLEYDSWVTIGMENSTQSGTVDALQDSGNNWIDNFESGLSFGAGDPVGGIWYTTTPETNGNSPDSKVLIGQFTTDGEISACLYFQIFPLGVQQDAFHIEVCGSTGDVPGCTDSTACNYNPVATEDDGSCTTLCPGCTDSVAVNFDPNATEDDGSCQYGGCMDTAASNYSSSADYDDGSCLYPGCTDPLAFNYDSTANDDDGTCDYNCDNTVVTIYMTDSFGDGWNGATWVISDNFGTVVGSGDLDTAPVTNQSSGQDIICLPDGCYTLSVGGGSFDSEIGWTLDGVTDGDVAGGFGSYFFQIGSSTCVLGCNDPAASNYDSAATLNDGSCIYPGCTISWAANFDPGANENDGSCTFELDGYVFYDGNLTGSFDGPDFGLAYQNVTLTPGDITVITDENGYYNFGVLPSGTYEVSVAENEIFPIQTTPLAYTVDDTALENTEDFNFGFADDDAYFAICVDFYPFVSGYPCNFFPVVHNICFRNMGTQTIDGVVQVDFDPLFAGYYEITPIDSVVGNSVYMSFENLMPGEMFFYDLGLYTPNVDAIGEFLVSNAYVYAMDGADVLAYGENTLEMEVTCAYDPNDKQVFPQGYEEEHYTLVDTELEYLVRFQNTGNAPAQTVLVRDTIAPELDLGSFALMANSHNVMTTIDPVTREIQFLFENIMLPDSTTNEPESHGLVSYVIKPYADTPAGTVVENTAYIFFDSNPAIVTNTTWNTIYECGDEANFDISDEVLCDEENLTGVATHDFVYTYNWSIDGEEFSDEAEWSMIMDEPGVYAINLIGMNPLCTSENEVNITVNPLPEAVITENGAMLVASDGSAWQWFLDGTPLEGETGQSIEIMDSGVYTVEVFNDSGCSTMSLGVTVTSVNDITNQVAVLFPNPMTERATLMLSEGNYKVSILDNRGQLVRVLGNTTGGTLVIERESLASGNYFIRVEDSMDSSKGILMKLIIK